MLLISLAFIRALIIITVTQSAASPGSLSTKPHITESPNQIFGFPWLSPIHDQTPQNVEEKIEFPSNALKNIMRRLPFRSAYHLLSRSKRFHSVLNPLERLDLNPLQYHDAYLDDQEAIKKVLALESLPKRLRYFWFLLDNPTVQVPKLHDSILKDAISLGDLKLIQKLISKGIFTENSIIYGAASVGNLPLLKELLMNSRTHNIDADLLLNIAIEQSNYEMVQYLVTKWDAKPDYLQLNWIIEYGDFDLVKSLIDRYDIQLYKGSIYAACRSGNFDMIKYFLQEKNLFPDRWAVMAAIKGGNLNAVSHIIQNYGIKYEEAFLDVAKLSRKKEIENYLRDLKKKLDEVEIRMITKSRSGGKHVRFEDELV